MSKLKVMTVFGTRPEAIKMAPLVLELQKHPEIEPLCCVTAQHREMLDSVLNIFKIKPDYDLNIMAPRQPLASITTKILTGLDEVLDRAKPDIVLVHGDTSTTFAGALASFYRGIKVGHVEAGLRSFDKYSPFPEEVNRKLTGNIADLHFCPTVNNAQNLKNEKIEGEIFITGNTVIDALFCLSDETIEQSKAFFKEKNITIDDKLVLITAHRRENHGERIDRIIDAILYLAEKYEDHTFVIPVHPNPNVYNKIHERLGNSLKIKISLLMTN